MSELILVRHGQASFGEASYDKLSEKGVEQVKILARHWQDVGERFDHVYSGTLLRQKETANELLSLVDGAPIENPAFNEYNGDPLIRVFLRDHAADAGFEVPDAWPIKDERLFQSLFEAACAKWIRGELVPTAEDSHFEQWKDFQDRVHTAIDQIMARHGNGSRVLISTSGGVIAMVLQRVLQFPDQAVITTNWMVRNSSVSRVKYGQGKVSLTQFNSLPHLERTGLLDMITYR
ncbi:MAG: histidine phosphatase family protein [Pseudohongiella sp.]|nr:MAG: histidine phosphatase family protein [Pseudohongiella sp.]